MIVESVNDIASDLYCSQPSTLIDQRATQSLSITMSLNKGNSDGVFSKF